MPKYSFIIPVYNRPQEVDELLDSLVSQKSDDFEVIVVEDGSTLDCGSVVDQYKDKLDLSYHEITNSGPGMARNHGASQSASEWLIFLDSDTLIPDHYLAAVDAFLEDNSVDAFGGADRDREDFLSIQKAISYSMTSFLTTGGIRGSKNSLEKFKPRSFNMGIRRSVFDELSGFNAMRYGEDIDFSLRIEEAGLATAYIPGAFVYHKRRTSFKAFFNQIMHSGEARVLLSKLHQGSFKLVHLFPSLFAIGLLIAILGSWLLPNIGTLLLAVYLAYFIAIGFDATIKSKSLKVGFLSIMASLVQLSAYAYGFVKAGTQSLIKG